MTVPFRDVRKETENVVRCFEQLAAGYRAVGDEISAARCDAKADEARTKIQSLDLCENPENGR